MKDRQYSEILMAFGYYLNCGVPAAQELASAIGSWSHAHRAGMGTLSDEEQQGMIDKAYKRMLSCAHIPMEEKDNEH